MKREIVSLAEELLESIMQEGNYELVDVEYLKESGQWYLRIYADKEGGITINDCEAISRAMEAKLDALDPIPDAYILEVSSPGLDRVLKKDKDFQRYLGYLVDVKLYKARNKKKEIQGELLSFSEQSITIQTETETLELERAEIAQVRLSVIL